MVYWKKITMIQSSIPKLKKCADSSETSSYRKSAYSVRESDNLVQMLFRWAIGNLYICYKYKVGNLNPRYINYYILFHHMVCWLTFQGSYIEDCQLILTLYLGLLLEFLCNNILYQCSIIWLSNISTLRVPDKGYSRKASCVHNIWIILFLNNVID